MRHNLNFLVVTMNIDKEQVFSLNSQVCDSSCQGDRFIIQEGSISNILGTISSYKLIISEGSFELMGIWVLTLISNALDELSSVLCVLSGIQNGLVGLLCRFVGGSCFSLLFGSLFSSFFLFSSLSLSFLQLTKKGL